MRRGLAVVLCLAACKNAGRKESADQPGQNWMPPTVPGIQGIPSDTLVAHIEQRLRQPPPVPLSAGNWKHVQRLYGALGPGPLWLDANGPIRNRERALLVALAGADSDAIQLDGLPLDSLRAALAALDSTATPTAAQLTTADVTLSSAYAAYADAMLGGQVSPRAVSQNWYIGVGEPRMDSALAMSLKTDSLAEGLARMRPQDAGYVTLRRALTWYRAFVARGGWPTLQPVGPITSKSIRSTRVALLQQRLQLEGYLPAKARTISARELSRAVTTFQRRHGIVADGIVGRETLDALNVPAEYRLGQIAANLERFRWLPREFGARYILVNVPEFRLDAYDSGAKTLSMRVIVGAEYNDRATPVFSDSMAFVIFRPYWNVPDDLAQREIWPRDIADSTYLNTNNYQVYRTRTGPHVRQRPGVKNDLGLVKFMFPNDFNIYLHDTPPTELFGKDIRAFSHGCIRLEHPDRLAQYVLGWDKAQVSQAMQGIDDDTVFVNQKIPVYIVYFTAYGLNGQLYFGNDLYARDDALVNAVVDGAQPSPEAIRAESTLVRR